MKPYYVDHWYLWSDGKLREKRYNCDDLESAESRFESLMGMEGTTRIVLCRRSGGSVSKIRVFSR